MFGVTLLFKGSKESHETGTAADAVIEVFSSGFVGPASGTAGWFMKPNAEVAGAGATTTSVFVSSDFTSKLSNIEEAWATSLARVSADFTLRSPNIFWLGGADGAS